MTVCARARVGKCKFDDGTEYYGENLKGRPHGDSPVNKTVNETVNETVNKTVSETVNETVNTTTRHSLRPSRPDTAPRRAQST